MHDGDDLVYGYEGNWRDIFQNWEALGVSYPGYLPQFITVFLNASTADGYNPYRITRAGIDWEVEDPDDPWSHIGYWGDHQIVYLLKLLEAYERHEPGALRAGLGDRIYSYADVPYRIGGFDSIVADPRHTITFDQARNESLLAAAQELGADGRLIRDDDGEVRLVTLAEKLLVPLLVKLTNLVPGSGIWLNTQRPEWNDANNALAGWGLSMVTLNAIVRYVRFLLDTFSRDDDVELSSSVRVLLDELHDIAARRPSCRPMMTSASRPWRVSDEPARHTGRRSMRERSARPRRRLRRSSARSWTTRLRLAEATIRASQRPDGLFHSYDILSTRRRRSPRRAPGTDAGRAGGGPRVRAPRRRRVGRAPAGPARQAASIAPTSTAICSIPTVLRCRSSSGTPSRDGRRSSTRRSSSSIARAPGISRPI